LVELGEDFFERPAERLHVLRSHQLGPARLDASAGGHGNGLDLLAARSEEDQSRTPVVRVGAPLDVTQLLEFLDRLRHRLLAHVRELGELADIDAVWGNKREDVRVRRTDVAEAGAVQRRVDRLGPVLVDEPEEQTERRVRRNGCLLNG
jgi:hypothetical protein